MSGSLQLLNKISILIIAIIILSNLSLAYEITADPYQLNFDLQPNREKCEEIWISSSEKEVYLEVLWADKETKNLEDFIYTSKDFKISEDIPEKITKNDKIEVCFKISEKARYNGILIIQNKEKTIGVGIWININEDLDFIKIYNSKKQTSLITGNTILNSPIEKKSSETLLIISGISLTLILLFVLFFIYRRNTKPY